MKQLTPITKQKTLERIDRRVERLLSLVKFNKNTAPMMADPAVEQLIIVLIKEIQRLTKEALSNEQN
jgi:hypothetical protein|tara:strand:+ start:367 stop:567 length:201 start_codon:yes stop_codon:yes gene_type:complete